MEIRDFGTPWMIGFMPTMLIGIFFTEELSTFLLIVTPIAIIVGFFVVLLYLWALRLIEEQVDHERAVELEAARPEIDMDPIFDLEEIHKARRAIDRAEKKKRKTAK